MLTTTLKETVNVSSLVVLIKRHVNDEGFCICCDQPWPCDVRLIKGILLREVI